MVEIYIGDVMLPFMPEEIKLMNADMSSRHTVLGLGEVEVLKGEKLQEVEFAGWLPAQKWPGVDNFRAPSEIKDTLCKYVESKKPVRFVYAGDGWDINFLVSIHGLQFSEKGGEVGALHYALTLRKWVDYSAKKITGASNQISAAERKDERETAKTYTVQQGDCLYHIAKAATGDASNWQAIYQINSDQIKNPNLIYPGQVLLLPTDANANAIVEKSRVKKQKTSATVNNNDNFVSFKQNSAAKNNISNAGSAALGNTRIFGNNGGMRVNSEYTKAVYEH